MHLIPAYIAGPDGFSEGGRFFYNEVYIPLIRGCGFIPLDPWQPSDPDLFKKAQEIPPGLARTSAYEQANWLAGQRNCKAIKTARLIIANLNGSDVDSGTAAEIGFAAGYGVPIQGYRSDFRLASDNEGSIVNLQVEYFITLSGGTIARSLEELRGDLHTWRHKLTHTRAT